MFTTNLPNTYYIPDSALGTEDTVVNSREESLALMELLRAMGEKAELRGVGSAG